MGYPSESVDGFRAVRLRTSTIMTVTKRSALRLITELLIYAALVSSYLVLVLHLLMGWLKELSGKEPRAYAFVAMLLMIGQAIGLERVASSLIHVTRHPRGR